ncbi:hypothetical protein TNCV_3736101 [Trichonephila clavipes]|nr:hypothetical protein TNCV_3736101 [Trichonephila clavipes]
MSVTKPSVKLPSSSFSSKTCLRKLSLQKYLSYFEGLGLYSLKSKFLAAPQTLSSVSSNAENTSGKLHFEWCSTLPSRSALSLLFSESGILSVSFSFSERTKLARSYIDPVQLQDGA